MPLTEWELQACAQHVLDHQGHGARVFVAKRIGVLATAGDTAGVSTWQAIAARLEQLDTLHAMPPAGPHDVQ